MDTFSKQDLQYDYIWSHYDQDDPRVSGIPDSTLFNKKQGEEVVFLVNYLTEHLAWSVEEFGAKVEKLIRDHLPTEDMSQKEVLEWIKKNWKTAVSENA